MPRGGGAKTAQSEKRMSGKTSYKKGEKLRKIKVGTGDLAALFGDGAPLQSLTRRAVPIWTCGPYAVEVPEAVNHDARLGGAKGCFGGLVVSRTT